MGMERVKTELKKILLIFILPIIINKIKLKYYQKEKEKGKQKRGTHWPFWIYKSANSKRI